MALTLKIQMILIGKANQLPLRLKYYEKQSTKIYQKISSLKLQDANRLPEVEFMEVFHGHSVSEVERILLNRGFHPDYIHLLCAFWRYDSDCPP